VAGHRIEGAVLVTKNSYRREIISAWSGVCAYCGDEPRNMTLDHVIPVARGGATVRSNQVPACARCNVSKSDSEVWGWYQNQPFFDADRAGRIRGWLAAG
jgi:hypothetical protein